MKNTLILTVTHRGLSDPTYESILESGCTNIIKIKNQACIDRARSIGFDTALRAFEQAPELDTLLCVDDDMVFEPEAATRLVHHARNLQHPVSAVACNSRGETTHRPWATQAGRYATGLAFMAIPRAALEKVAEELPMCGPIRVWCLTGPSAQFPGEWIGEDYSFCSLFKGVELATEVHVGHVKQTVLWPTLELGLSKS